MSIRQLLDDAERQVNTYKYPNITEFRQVINEILEAADLGSTGNDEITNIDEYNDSIRISTSWSCRGCECSSDFELPSFIIDSEDPIKVAKIWSLENKIKSCKTQLEQAKKSVISNEASLKKLNSALKDIQ